MWALGFLFAASASASLCPLGTAEAAVSLTCAPFQSTTGDTSRPQCSTVCAFCDGRQSAAASAGVALSWEVAVPDVFEGRASVVSGVGGVTGVHYVTRAPSIGTSHSYVVDVDGVDIAALELTGPAGCGATCNTASDETYAAFPAGVGTQALTVGLRAGGVSAVPVDVAEVNLTLCVAPWPAVVAGGEYGVLTFGNGSAAGGVLAVRGAGFLSDAGSSGNWTCSFGDVVTIGRVINSTALACDLPGCHDAAAVEGFGGALAVRVSPPDSSSQVACSAKLALCPRGVAECGGGDAGPWAQVTGGPACGGLTTLNAGVEAVSPKVLVANVSTVVTFTGAAVGGDDAAFLTAVATQSACDAGLSVLSGGALSADQTTTVVAMVGDNTTRVALCYSFCALSDILPPVLWLAASRGVNLHPTLGFDVKGVTGVTIATRTVEEGASVAATVSGWGFTAADSLHLISVSSNAAAAPIPCASLAGTQVSSEVGPATETPSESVFHPIVLSVGNHTLVPCLTLDGAAAAAFPAFAARVVVTPKPPAEAWSPPMWLIAGSVVVVVAAVGGLLAYFKSVRTTRSRKQRQGGLGVLDDVTAEPLRRPTVATQPTAMAKYRAKRKGRSLPSPQAKVHPSNHI